MVPTQARAVKPDALRVDALRRQFQLYATLASSDGSKAGRVVARYLERAADKLRKGTR